MKLFPKNSKKQVNEKPKISLVFNYGQKSYTTTLTEIQSIAVLTVLGIRNFDKDGLGECYSDKTLKKRCF